MPHAVDCHAHVFSSGAPAVPDARYRPAYEATLAAWRERWAASGITHGVLVQPSFFGTDNAEMLAAIASMPDRLRGVVVLAPDATQASIAELDARGARALRLNLKGRAHDAAALAAWLPLLDRAHAAGWHLEVFGEAGAAPGIAEALATTPVDVVFDHFAFPAPGRELETLEALARLAQSREVGVKLSAPYRLPGCDAAALARDWLQRLGARALLWGSDWPWTAHEEGRDYGALLDSLEASIGADAARAALWDNPARRYRFAER
jgi:predicted TIM-barrel fold metal-dependent hydrolase